MVMARKKQIERTRKICFSMLLDSSEDIHSEMENIERAVEMPDLNEMIHELEEVIYSLCLMKVKSSLKNKKRKLENSFIENLLEGFVCKNSDRIDGQKRFIAFKGSSVPI